MGYIPTNRKTGSKFAQEQPARAGRNEAGTFTDRVFETTNYYQALGYVQMAEANGLLYDTADSFGKYTVTIHYPWNILNDPAQEPGVSLWEISNQMVQKSILDSNNIIANACTQAEIYILGLFLENKSDYILQPTDGMTVTPQTGKIHYPETDTTGNESNKTLALNVGSAARTLANLIACGVESYNIFQPQLKHTLSVCQQYRFIPPYTNVGYLVSTATMYALYDIPPNLMFQLPDLINPAPADGKPVLNYGWFVNAPQANQITRLKFQLIQSFDFGLWPIDIYGVPL
jgi:hypothetical protein